MSELPKTSEHPIERVKGGTTLPNDAFLKALPLVVAPEQRLVLDALRVASDMAASSYNLLFQVAIQTIKDHDSGANPAIVHLAWAIVDQLYSIRKLLARLNPSEPPGPVTQAFIDATSDVPHLRNRVDHLDAKIPNIAKKKGPERSLFGSVSYIADAGLAGQPENDVVMVLHHIEPIRPGEGLASTRMPGLVRLPIGNFRLHADEKALDIDEAIIRLCDMIARINENVETSAKELIEKTAEEHGVPAEELTRHFGAGLRLVLSMRRA